MSTALRTEERAFESLYRLNRPVIYAYALSRLRNPSDAEDVTQTTFLNAYTALHRGVTPRDELQWLIAIAKNACRDRFREAKRRHEEPLEDWAPVVQPEAPDYSIGELTKEIAELHPRHRQIILMREFEGRSYSEISDKLGVSEAAVQALLVRARRTLRDELELGITCAQARRISLRHLNGVAVRDERRALQRHLRKCDECATFVGHRPPSLAGLLLLPTLPFRKLWAFFAGTSGAPVGTTAGGGGAIAAKVLAVTAIGSTAVGVTVKEVAGPPTPSHSPAAPKTRPAVAPIHHPSVRVQPAPATTWASFRGSSPAHRPEPLTHATAQRPQHPTTQPARAPHSPPAAILPPSTSVLQPPPATAPAETAQAPPAEQAPVTSQAADGPSTPADPASSDAAPSPSPPAATAPETVTTPATVTTGPVTTSTDTPPPATPSAAVDPSTAVVPPPVATPSSSSPPPSTTPEAATDNGNGNGTANGVGRGGTPPGQGGTKPDSRGHS